MLRFLHRHMILKFGRHYGYDVGYMLHMLEGAPAAMGAFNALSKLAGYRTAAPLDAHRAAGLMGVVAEDCGPCVQLTADMAREAGMAADQIEAVLTGDRAAMSEDTALGHRFAKAILARSADAAAARDAVRAVWGDAGVIELTLATQVVRVFPMVKAGLGYGKSCGRIDLGSRTVAVGKAAT